MPIDQSGYNQLSLKIQMAESQGKQLAVNTPQGLVRVDHNKGLHNTKTFRCDSGVMTYDQIKGYQLLDSSQRFDSLENPSETAYDDPYASNVLMGGFTSVPLPQSDRARQDGHRELLKQRQDGTISAEEYKQRKDSISAVATVSPTITLDATTRNNVKQMIENGENRQAIETRIGRVDSSDLKEICDELGLSTIDRIFQCLT